MKRYLIWAALILLAIGGIYALSNVEARTKITNTVEIVEKEVQVQELEVRIEAAQDAARTEIETEAQAAYQDLYNLRMTEIENEIIDEYQAELDARKASNTEAVQAY